MSKAVSVVMPVRNGINYLERSLSSITSCTTELDEIVIVDDGSEDGTFQYLENYTKVMRNVILVKNPGNGIVDALNYGITIAKNQWIARFDVDDVYPADRLHEQKKLIKEGIAVIFSDYLFKDQDGNSLGIVPSPIFPEATALSLINNFRTAHSSALFNREIFLESGKYQSYDFPAEDLGLWLRMLQFGQLVSVPKVLLYYRISNGSISSGYRNEMNSKRIDLLKRYTIPTKNLEYIFENWAEVIESYKSLEYSSRRLLLLCRDLISLASILGLKKRRRIAVLKLLLLLLNPCHVITLLHLIIEKQQRHKIRKSFK